MIPALLGTKIGMTRVIVERGAVETVTVVKAGPCVVLQVKNKTRDGYDAVQLGFEDCKPHRSTKALIGHASRAGTGPKRHLREVRLSGPATVSPGDVITVEQFVGGKVSHVDVSGVTKGKGFQGVMKRHGFGGMCSSHGTERKHRSPGGIGGNATRGHGRCIKKGKRMAGHMGHERKTASGLKVCGVDAANDLLLIQGSVPGANGGIVLICLARKALERG